MVDYKKDTKISIEDERLEAELCRWFGLLRNIKIKLSTTGEEIFLPMDMDTLRGLFKSMYTNDGQYSATMLEHAKMADMYIKNALRMLLNKYGISEDVEFLLTNYDEEKCTFTCVNDSKRVEVGLEYPNMYTRAQFISLESEKENKRYSYDLYDSKIKYTVVNYGMEENGRRVSRHYDDSHYYLSVKSGEDLVFIDIEYPSRLIDKHNNIYFLNEVLEKELLSMEGSLSITRVYDIVARRISSLKYEFKTFPKVFIQKSIVKDDNHKDEIITDRLEFVDGELVNFIYTNNGRKVSINKNGEWTVESDGQRVHTDKSGSIDFSLYVRDSAQLGRLKTVQELYDDATNAVSDAYLLSYDLVEKRGKGL